MLNYSQTTKLTATNARPLRLCPKDLLLTRMQACAARTGMPPPRTLFSGRTHRAKGGASLQATWPEFQISSRCCRVICREVVALCRARRKSLTSCGMDLPAMRGSQLQKALFAPEQGRADVARRRRWRSLKDRRDPNRLIFIDETWIKANMAPLHGWESVSERLRGFAPHAVTGESGPSSAPYALSNSLRLACSTDRSTAKAFAPMSNVLPTECRNYFVNAGHASIKG